MASHMSPARAIDAPYPDAPSNRWQTPVTVTWTMHRASPTPGSFNKASFAGHAQGGSATSPCGVLGTGGDHRRSAAGYAATTSSPASRFSSRQRAEHGRANRIEKARRGARGTVEAPGERRPVRPSFERQLERIVCGWECDALDRAVVEL